MTRATEIHQKTINLTGINLKDVYSKVKV